MKLYYKHGNYRWFRWQLGAWRLERIGNSDGSMSLRLIHKRNIKKEGYAQKDVVYEKIKKPYKRSEI